MFSFFFVKAPVCIKRSCLFFIIITEAKQFRQLKRMRLVIDGETLHLSQCDSVSLAILRPRAALAANLNGRFAIGPFSRQSREISSGVLSP